MMQGILIVDKPMDWTSFDVVAKLRGVLGTRNSSSTSCKIGRAHV